MALNPLARASNALGFGSIPRAAKPAKAAPARAESGDPDEPPAEREDEEKAKRARLDGESDEDYAARMQALDEEQEEEEREVEDAQDREEMRGNTAIAQARTRATQRCLAIFGHPAAAANLPLATKLAASSMGRHEACAILAEAPARAARPKGQLSEAMDGFAAQRPGPGAAAPLSGQAAIDKSWDAALVRAGVLPRT